MGKLGIGSDLKTWGEPRVMVGRSQKHSYSSGGKEKPLSVPMDWAGKAASRGLTGVLSASWGLTAWQGLVGLTLSHTLSHAEQSMSWEHPWIAAGLPANWLSARWAGQKSPTNQSQQQYHRDRACGTPGTLRSRPHCGLVLMHLIPELFWFPGGIFFISVTNHDKGPKRFIAQLSTNNKLVIVFFANIANY